MLNSTESASHVVFVNARLIPLNGRPAHGTCLLVEDGRVAAVGSLMDVLPHSGGAPVIDCGGAAVLPGFVDGHCHFELTCVTTDAWVHVHTPPHRSLHEVAMSVRSALEEPRGASDWLLCRSSFSMHEKVEEGRLLLREELDAISDERPIAVFASLHVASLNSVALRRLGLWDADSPHPFHGVVHRHPDGTPTGVVTEIFMMVPTPMTPEQFDLSVMGHARDLFNASGTTTVHTMPENLDQVYRQRQLHRTGSMSLRQRYYLISPGVATLDEAEELARADCSADTFRFGGIKVFVNGCAHDGLGHPLDDVKWDQQQLDAFVGDASQRGFQVWMHSLNASGVRMAARAILSAYPDGSNPLRHRIEHGADFIDLQDLSVVKRSGALLVTTPQFLHSMTTDPTGPRAPLRSLLDSGIRLVGATDSTGTVPSSVSILGNVATAVARRRSTGEPFHSSEAITVTEALALFTTGSAYGGHSDGLVGTLEVGAYADFVLLEHDPTAPESPPPDQIAVLATYLAGEPVWRLGDA